MKAALIVLVACVAAASAQIDCTACKEYITKLGTFLTTPEEIEAEKLVLKALVCEVSDDPAGCAAGVDKHWEPMAKAIFGYAETPNDICTAGGICKKALPCSECKGLVSKLSALFQDQTFVATVLEKVRGFLYCDTVADAAECKAFVDAYGAQAMPVLGEAIVAESDKICKALGCEGRKKYF